MRKCLVGLLVEVGLGFVVWCGSGCVELQSSYQGWADTTGGCKVLFS